ncbi:zinc-binding dehydrogenase [Actinomadura chibensis]|uniref:Zinc-binding dehydrogenase n=2 Tax=Actinomadura chibensis TaxID=392828 RepID=A0A5D0P0B0_9ACTN|nr:zinc-binding dehydrogenase [Actinomadura chibensis]
MRAVVLHEFGSPDVLRPERIPVPAPGPGQVLVKVEAVGVGYAQTQMRGDRFPAPMWSPSLPLVLGGDVVGEVVRLGPGVPGTARVGARVGAYTLLGAYAEYVAVDAAALLPVPAELDAAVATAIPAPGPIAAGTLDAARFRPGESVLVHAAAGGIGHLSVQLARRKGAGLVIGTAGGPARAGFAAELGADVAVDRHAGPWDDQVRAATGGAGVDVILDSAGGRTLLEGIDLLAPRGRLVFYGSSGGGRDVPDVPLLKLLGMRSVTGFTLSGWRAARPKQFHAEHVELASALLSEEVRHEIGATLPLSEAAEAHRLVESGMCPGRVVLTP